jgi:hypothetical protein
MILIIIFTLFILGVATATLIIRKKQIHLWLGHYLKRKLSQKNDNNEIKHIMFCFVDHYEPMWGKDISYEQECARVERWHIDYPKVASKFKDADGCYPKHSFYYPEEEYRREHLDKITELCSSGFGEIEIHLHHDNDTSENLRKTLNDFTELLHKNHGAFTRSEETGLLQYSFIHGNWCLNNSRPDGKWCGVNDELIILKETGCYADLTFPSAPSETQPYLANEIYYAKDIPNQPKSHNKGKRVEVNMSPWGDMMLITGPLGLNWKHRKKGIFPQIENSDIRGSMPPTKERIDLWVDTAITVKGKSDWLFIKIHTHGTQEESMDTLLGQPFADMNEYLLDKYNDGKNYLMHFTSGREMYNIIKAAESGETGNPNLYRDYIVAAPKYKNSSDKNS